MNPEVLVGDARDLRSLWGAREAPSSIVTSPPYADMMDYGIPGQIGHGQTRDDYLSDVASVLSACYEISKDDATLWLVVGAIRRNGRLIDLPGDIARAAADSGWVLREEVTWDKAKALPWAKRGELRDVVERALLFSKTDAYRFDTTVIRSPEPQSIWWQRYPERYAPNGTLPTNVWTIPIPTQGAWTGLRTHYCPFPPELSYRLVALTSDVGDTILDPFAGIGSIPAMAAELGRMGVGIELSAEFAALAPQASESARGFLRSLDVADGRRELYRRVILDLRLLKYTRILAKRLRDKGFDLRWAFVRKARRRPRGTWDVAAADIDLAAHGDETSRPRLLMTAHQLASARPLSKFGIDSTFQAISPDAPPVGCYWYPDGRFWRAPARRLPEGVTPAVGAWFQPEAATLDDTPYP